MFVKRVILIAAITLLFSHCERQESAMDYSHIDIPEPQLPKSQRWWIETLTTTWNKANGISDFRLRNTSGAPGVNRIKLTALGNFYGATCPRSRVITRDSSSISKPSSPLCS